MAKAISVNKWLVAGAAGAIAWLCIHRKKGVSGIGRVEYDQDWGETFIVDAKGNNAIRIKRRDYGYDLWLVYRRKLFGGRGYYWESSYPISDRYYKTLDGTKKAILRFCKIRGMKINEKELAALTEADIID